MLEPCKRTLAWSNSRESSALVSSTSCEVQAFFGSSSTSYNQLAMQQASGKTGLLQDLYE